MPYDNMDKAIQSAASDKNKKVELLKEEIAKMRKKMQSAGMEERKMMQQKIMMMEKEMKMMMA